MQTRSSSPPEPSFHDLGSLSVAVVGAGVAGLVAAQTLAEHGVTVQVFDKGRGAGGRISTRRHGEHTFDHGAQYFTARGEAFRLQVQSWVEEGVVAPWAGRLMALAPKSVEPVPEAIGRYVGVPGMSAVARHLAAAVEPRLGVRVERLEPAHPGWTLRDTDGQDLGRFDAVLLSVPPAQAVPFLERAPELAALAASVELLPCWALMVCFDTPLESEFDGAFVNGPDEEPWNALSWVARDSSKPGRPPGERWVLHGAPGWSAQNLEEEPEVVTRRLLDAFFQITGLPPRDPIFLRAHRWRYSIARAPLTEGYLWDGNLGLGLCGDWCSGSRVEGAFSSGLALAGRVLSLPRHPLPGGH